MTTHAIRNGEEHPPLLEIRMGTEDIEIVFVVISFTTGIRQIADFDVVYELAVFDLLDNPRHEDTPFELKFPTK